MHGSIHVPRLPLKAHDLCGCSCYVHFNAIIGASLSEPHAYREPAEISALLLACIMYDTSSLCARIVGRSVRMSIVTGSIPGNDMLFFQDPEVLLFTHIHVHHDQHANDRDCMFYT